MWFPAIESVNEIVLTLLIALGIIYLMSGVDDATVDLIAIIFGTFPKFISQRQMDILDTLPEKHIAIIIPAWKEGNIIDRMLLGNRNHIDYQHYHFFVGVYPNDMLTVKKVKELEKQYPNVHAVINYRDGPTSKGQILNHVIGEILAFENRTGIIFAGFHMQDAEDLIHPKVLKLANYKLERYDFVQVPVFSLEVKASRLVAGTYMDEFAENHTKDILVRNKVAAAVPSAGVGTTLSRRLVMAALKENRGCLFNHESLTEDYELGIRSFASGCRATFACTYYRDPKTQKREYIATREFFPSGFSRSVRQKTRWTTGIVLQGWRNLGWMGSLWNRYFLLRDRKGIITNIATFLGYPTLLWSWWYSHSIDPQPLQLLFQNEMLRIIFISNLFLMVNRVIQRNLCTWRVYGYYGILTVLVRWPVGITINALAGACSLRDDMVSRFTKVSQKWAKTEHELPDYFGQPNANLEAVS